MHSEGRREPGWRRGLRRRVDRWLVLRWSTGQRAGRGDIDQDPSTICSDSLSPQGVLGPRRDGLGDRVRSLTGPILVGLGTLVASCSTDVPFTSARDSGVGAVRDGAAGDGGPMDVGMRLDAGEDAPVGADVPAEAQVNTPDIIVSQTCERANHNFCSSDAQCCPGVPCTRGVNRQDCCKPVAWACSTDDECCGRRCEGGVCTCTSEVMSASTHSCLGDSDCCGGLGCSPFTARCCVRTGQGCSAAADCCIRACYDGICCRHRYDGVCSSDAECCAGLGCNSPGPGASYTCCNLGGGRCSVNSDCCGSLLCAAGRCCAGDSGACRTNADCCNNSCFGGQCTCVRVGGACSTASTCCAGGGCEGGRCCSNPAGECREDRDCCGTGSVCVGTHCCRAVGGSCRSGRDCCSSRCDVDHCVL